MKHGNAELESALQDLVDTALVADFYELREQMSFVDGILAAILALAPMLKLSGKDLLTAHFMFAAIQRARWQIEIERGPD